MTGTVERVLVDVGDEVERGQLLATLDRVELDARTESARRSVSAARQQVALADANLAKAHADLGLARSTYKRNQGLASAGLISQQTLDESRAGFAAAEANERAGGVAINARRAEVDGLVAQQRLAETVASYTQIVAPMKAVITRRALEPGSTVSAGTTIFEMVDADALWVAARIDESLAGGVRVGQVANIHLRSGADWSGHVARVALLADPVSRELEIYVAFDRRPQRFAIHEEADVTIFGEEAHGLLVPPAAIVHQGGVPSVFVVQGDRARERRVQLGIRGSGGIEVLDGLRGGETVVTAPAELRDGSRVAPKASGE
jgi:HlyD family secretion protein